MKHILLLFMLTNLLVQSCISQKKQLDTSDYQKWKRISNPALSYDGQWALYDIYGNGTSYKHLVNIHTGEDRLLEGVSNPVFFNRGKWMKYSTGDSLLLLRLKDGRKIHWTSSRFILDNISSPLVSYSDARHVVCWNIDTGDSTVLEAVNSYTLYNNNQSIIFLRGNTLFAGPLKGKHINLFHGTVTTYSFNKETRKGTFLSGSILYSFSVDGKAPQELLDFKNITLPAGYRVIPKAYEITTETKQLLLEVSYTGKSLPVAKPNPMAADLELWTWNEPISQRRQRRGVYNRTMMDDAKFIYHLDSQKVVTVAPEFSGLLFVPAKETVDYVLLTDPGPYLSALDWTYDANEDIYLVNTRTGQRKLAAKNCTEHPQWSPNGNFAVIYNGNARSWMLLNPTTGIFENLSGQLKYAVHDEDMDMPKAPSSYGLAGWMDGGNTIVVYDRYDMWALDLRGQQPPRSLTNGYGRMHNTSLRLQGASYGGMLDAGQPLLLRGFNEVTKSAGVYRIFPFKKMETLANDSAYSVNIVAKADGGSSLLLTRQSFSQYPDLWWSSGDMKWQKRLTYVNAHQSDYVWGKAEVVSWKNSGGYQNEGLLYLPENYQPGTAYPMIVDFYETHSSERHQYMTPGYSTATIDIPTYVSNGYLVFRPDVHYTIGKAGESAYDAIVTGTQFLIDLGIADKTHIGLQGHSFGGFEVAYIATKTAMFKCINIGAGAVNATYNYSSVRANGAPGLFKYEVEQYRIGKSLWENKQSYLSNSPIFNADRITSPLLILHNDKDGAVPFTQGLDLFFAMRRLNRPAWLLNYKGQNHTLEEFAPQFDWTLRMRQFFDHYLKEKPIPRWMKEGINIDERKIDLKYDY